METFLFDSIIFGPVNSRRLGISLGINLLPNDCKVCNFNCIYCECGWTNKNIPSSRKKFHPRFHVKENLENKFKELKKSGSPIETITFAGNGEPTLHPDFDKIIDDTIELRNKYFSSAQIAVLSNSTLINKKSVFNALNKVEQNILKIDSAFEETINTHNDPPENFNLDELVEDLKKFKGNLIIQTLFLKGVYDGKTIDNTTKKEVDAWLKLIQKISPKLVMIYTIKRNTPTHKLFQIPFSDLESIAKRMEKQGIKTQISD